MEIGGVAVFNRAIDRSLNSLAADPAVSQSVTCVTASALNLAVYACFGIFIVPNLKGLTIARDSL
jgi:hypothetical protein